MPTGEAFNLCGKITPKETSATNGGQTRSTCFKIVQTPNRSGMRTFAQASARAGNTKTYLG